MEKKEATIGLGLYKNYGICEWHEKCQILTTKEKIRVLTDLRRNVRSDLVTLVRLPFPKFVEAYFGQFPNFDGIKADPSFPYKLYFLNDGELRLFTESIRTPEKSFEEIKSVFGSLATHVIDRTKEILALNFEDLNKPTSLAGNSKLQKIKFIYLTQYIGLKEAERLGLPVAQYFMANSVPGYEFEAKMNILNPTAKTIITLLLGLYGHKRCSVREIAEKLGISHNVIRPYVDCILPFLDMPYRIFKEKIGFKEQHQIPGCMKQYDNREYRKRDVSLEKHTIYNKLDDEEKSHIIDKSGGNFASCNNGNVSQRRSLVSKFRNI